MSRMRVVLVVVSMIGLAVGCGKKQAPQAPAAAPPAEETKAADDAAPGGPMDESAPTGGESGDGVEGDPCDGGEAK